MKHVAPVMGTPTLMLPPLGQHPSTIFFRDGTSMTVTAAPGEAIAIPQAHVQDKLVAGWRKA